MNDVTVDLHRSAQRKDDRATTADRDDLEATLALALTLAGRLERVRRAMSQHDDALRLASALTLNIVDLLESTCRR